MKFLKQSTVKQQAEVNQSRRFTTGQYIAAVFVMLFSVTAISYATGMLKLTEFKTGTPVSSADVNKNFKDIHDALETMKATIDNNAVPAGTLVAFSGTVVPAGYLRCPTTLIAATVKQADYLALFTAIGGTWGPVSTDTFVMPWFPEGYALLQTNAAVGAQSVGTVIAHSHTLAIINTSGNAGSSGYPGTVPGSSDTGTTGGTANLAAGTKVIILVKY